MNRNPKHLEVVLGMEDIERVLLSNKTRDPKVCPQVFADLAWSRAGGTRNPKIRATGNIGSDLVLDGSNLPLDPLVLAYVAIPKVIFAGYVIPAEVPHPSRVLVADLRDVRELLHHAWQGYLEKVSPPIPNTAIGYLSTPCE